MSTYKDKDLLQKILHPLQLVHGGSIYRVINKMQEFSYFNRLVFNLFHYLIIFLLLTCHVVIYLNGISTSSGLAMRGGLLIKLDFNIQ